MKTEYPLIEHGALVRRLPDSTEANREWTGNDENGNQHHGKVPLSERPFRLRLFWKQNSDAPHSFVGCYELNLTNLLAAGLVRNEGNHPGMVRLRFYRAREGFIFIASSGQRRLLPIGTCHYRP